MATSTWILFCACLCIRLPSIAGRRVGQGSSASEKGANIFRVSQETEKTNYHHEKCKLTKLLLQVLLGFEKFKSIAVVCVNCNRHCNVIGLPNLSKRPLLVSAFPTTRRSARSDNHDGGFYRVPVLSRQAGQRHRLLEHWARRR